MHIAIIDTETTGLDQHDEPLSIGIILASIGERGELLQEVAHYEGLREPSVPIHPKAQAVHGLTTEVLQGRTFDIEKVQSLLSQAEVLIAHNAAFDARMLAKVLEIDAKWRCSYRQFPWPAMTNQKLDTVCATFNVERTQQHGAMSDARALLHCLTVRTGKTDRSKTYLKKLLEKPDFNVTPRRSRPDATETVTHRVEFTLDDFISPEGYQAPPPPPPPKSNHWASIGAAIAKIFGFMLMALVGVIGALLKSATKPGKRR